MSGSSCRPFPTRQRSRDLAACRRISNPSSAAPAFGRLAGCEIRARTGSVRVGPTTGSAHRLRQHSVEDRRGRSQAGTLQSSCKMRVKARNRSITQKVLACRSSADADGRKSGGAGSKRESRTLTSFGPIALGSCRSSLRDGLQGASIAAVH